MLKRLGQFAEDTATNVSRRHFLGKLGTFALSVAAAAGGLLALTSVTHAGRRQVLCNGMFSTSSCVNNLVGGPCGSGGKCTVTKGTVDHCYCRDPGGPGRGH
jgi:hypothetical protein